MKTYKKEKYRHTHTHTHSLYKIVWQEVLHVSVLNGEVTTYMVKGGHTIKVYYYCYLSLHLSSSV